MNNTKSIAAETEQDDSFDVSPYMMHAILGLSVVGLFTICVSIVYAITKLLDWMLLMGYIAP